MFYNEDLVWEACREREALVRKHLQQRRMVRAAEMQVHDAQPRLARRVSHWTGGVLVAAGRRLQMGATHSSGMGEPTT